MTDTAFLLSAGFGTRFQPQTNFIPKPAIPFFGLPQALYPAGLLKNIGVENFFYNSHHLPNKLDSALKPFLKNKSIFEKEILDSAGGIANAKDSIGDSENFWVLNGDSLVTSVNDEVLKEAYDFHISTNSTATLIGVPKDNPMIGGLGFDRDNGFTHISKDPDCLQFIGFYIFNKNIFNFLKPEKSHIFRDVLLNNFTEKASVFNAGSNLNWYETGNEKDFINCHRREAQNLIGQKQNSPVFTTHQTWGIKADHLLEQFLENHIWGAQSKEQTEGDFLILPNEYKGSVANLKNCVVVESLDLPSDQKFIDRVLVDSSQWT